MTDISKSRILSVARKALHTEMLSLQHLEESLDDSFVEACDQHLTVVTKWLEKAAPDAAQSFRELHAIAEELFTYHPMKVGEFLDQLL